MANRLWRVTKETEASDIVWAASEQEAKDLADLSDPSFYELSADILDSHAFLSAEDRKRDVWTGEEYKSVDDLLAMLTPEYFADAERKEREKAEFDAHPKLLEV